MIGKEHGQCGGRLLPTRRLRQTPEHAVLAEEAFRQAVGQERLRADRCHRPFSLVVFRLPEGCVRPATDPQVVGIVVRHTRFTDEVGRLGPSGIGVLLRDTAGERARRYSARMAAELAKIGADTVWRVVGYPISGDPVEGRIPAGQSEDCWMTDATASTRNEWLTTVRREMG